MPVAAGQKIRASYFNAVPVSESDSTVVDGTTTSTSYTNTLTTTGIRGKAFTAPITGNVLILFSALGRHGTSGKSVSVDVEVKTGSTVGSGTLVRGSADITADVEQNAAAGQNLHHTGFATVTGLTAGASYNACLTYKLIDAGTGTFSCRNITIVPA